MYLPYYNCPCIRKNDTDDTDQLPSLSSMARIYPLLFYTTVCIFSAIMIRLYIYIFQVAILLSGVKPQKDEATQEGRQLLGLGLNPQMGFMGLGGLGGLRPCSPPLCKVRKQNQFLD